jgi:hypothetical protein
LHAGSDDGRFQRLSRLEFRQRWPSMEDVESPEEQVVDMNRSKPGAIVADHRRLVILSAIAPVKAHAHVPDHSRRRPETGRGRVNEGDRPSF